MANNAIKGQVQMLCSDMVPLHVQMKSGGLHSRIVNLEQIWRSGAVFLSDTKVPRADRLWLVCGGRTFEGKIVRQEFQEELGYLVEIEFDRGHEWSCRKYRPKHMLNPMVIFARRVFGAQPGVPLFRTAVSSAAALRGNRKESCSLQSMRRRVAHA